LTLARGMLERTKNTPIPFTYTLALRRLTPVFRFLVPFGLHDVASLWTPLLAVIICCIFFFGLDMHAEVMAAPFSDTFMVIPLDSMTRGVEIFILDSLGEENLPDLIQPNDFVLT